MRPADLGARNELPRGAAAAARRCMTATAERPSTSITALRRHVPSSQRWATLSRPGVVGATRFRGGTCSPMSPPRDS
jgi:hypothetical protein